MQRFVFVNDVKSQTNWLLDLEAESASEVPIQVRVGFQQQIGIIDQTAPNSTFYRTPAGSQCIEGPEKNLV